MIRSVPWIGPVPEGMRLESVFSYPEIIHEDSAVPCAITGELLRSQTARHYFRAVPVIGPDVNAETESDTLGFPMLSDEKIAQMIVTSYQETGEIPNPGGNPPSEGNGGARSRLTRVPGPMNPKGGAAAKVPAFIRP